MAIITMVIGQSGTGKSTSLRNFNPNEVAVINVSGKPMPFKSGIKSYNTDDYTKIAEAIAATERKIIVIDDASYLLVGEFMRRLKDVGYQKFNDMAGNFYNLVKMCASLPEDKTVYFLGHIDTDANGDEKFKTVGKLLDEKVTLEGLFTIVLKAVVTDGHYQFSTQNNGHDTVKSPMGMFTNPLIDNDLKLVDNAIREFYGIQLKPATVKKETKEGEK